MKYSEIPSKTVHWKILVVEDDAVSFLYLARLLQKLDMTIIRAENGEQAVEIVRNIPDIKIILMDIRLPVMDGMQATKLIKQLRPDLPVLVQTAYAFDAEKNKIMESGCDEYLTKPLDQAKLTAVFHKYLK